MRVTVESVFTQAAELCDDLAAQVEPRQKILRLAACAVLSGALYGATMGLSHSPLQAAASAIKVPVLFLLTLAVCAPALHFLGLLFGAPTRFEQSFGVLVAGVCRSSILLGAFAPISLFFLLSRSDYPFLLLMHTAIFAFCGAAGLVTMHRDYARVQQGTGNAGQQRALWLLRGWMVLYMFVGAQMAWNLSPFVNQPGREVLLVNPHKGNIYSYLAGVLRDAYSAEAAGGEP